VINACQLIAALTGAVAGASLLAHDAVSGPVPCSGARRQDKALDEVSAAILGDAVAENNILICFCSISGIYWIVNV
jgi:hypothetical protein